MPEGLELSFGSYDLLGDAAGDILIVTYGRIFANAFEARERAKADGINNISVLKLNRIKPIDEAAYKLATGFKKVLFFEEGIKNGGIGETYISGISSMGYTGKCNLIAINDEFVQHAKVNRLLSLLKLDADGIYEQIILEMKNIEQ